MNESRFSYLKLLPLVLLVSLFTAGIQIYHDLHYDDATDNSRFDWLLLLIFLIRNATLWTALAMAFRTIKASAIAFGVAVIMYFIDLFLIKNNLQGSAVVMNLQSLLFNTTFLPAIVFALICFKKQGLRHFWPVWLFAVTTLLLSVGSIYLELSPYNMWYRFVHVDDILRVPTGEHSYRTVNLLFQVAHPAILCFTYILYAECYLAATHKLNWRSFFRIDLSTRYTKPAALSIFYTFRILINLLVVGLFTYPSAFLFPGDAAFLKGQPAIAMVPGIAGALALLVTGTLYYRKFLVEYFISSGRKISWLFWIVNFPILGMLVFPLVVLSFKTIPAVEDRTRFFFKEAPHNQQPGMIMILTLFLSLIGMGFAEMADVSSTSTWAFWVIDVLIFILYCVSVRAYKVIVGSAFVGILLFYGWLTVEALARGNYVQNSAIYNRHNIAMLLISAFTIVQYTVLLPIYHIEIIKTEQEPNTVDEFAYEVA
jgi:hypothetical protein